MANKKERKYAKITIEVDGESVRKSIAYYTLAEFAQKKKDLEERAKRQQMKKFSDVAEAWQEEHEQEVQTYTRSCYVKPVKDLIDAFGDYVIADITSLMFQRFLNDMGKKGFARQTINLRKIAMNQIFNYAVFHNMIVYNPISVCKTPKKAKNGTRELPSDKDVEIIKANADDPCGLYCNLLLYTGLRREEALALTYEDINFENNTVFVSKVVIFESNVPSIRDSAKSDAGLRTVPLLAPLKELIEKQPNKSGLIFNKNGELLKKGEFDRMFNKYRRAHGLSCTSHQLRHYFATLCFEAELDEKDVQEIMGHSSISLTRDIYTHIRKQRREKTAKKLDAFLSISEGTAEMSTECPQMLRKAHG